MKTPLNKKQAIEKINSFFEKSDFSPDELKKIKRLAMKYKIRLKEKRKSFCKKCLNALKGKTRINNKSKSVVCKYCNYKNKFKLS